MTRNLKALGLALMAALALGAVAASAASAESHHFVGVKGDKLSSASLTEFQTFESTTGEEKGYKCKKAEVGAKGEVETATATSVTVEPKYDECEAFGPRAPAKVEANGCHFTYTGVTTSGNPTGGEHASVDIICPPEKEITLRVTALNVKCGAIPPQEVEHAVRYENETTAGDGKTHVKVIATAHGIDSTTIDKCGNGEIHNNGSYTGNITVTAPNGLSITKT